MRLSAVAAATFTLSTLAVARTQEETAACPCGYTVNETSSEDGWAQWTEMFESDFLHVSDLTNDDGNTWIPQAFNVSQKESTGPFGKTSQTQNVVPNPNGRPYDWNSPGIIDSDPGLQLWVRKELVNGMVPMAEMVSARDDILYGSFRIGMLTTHIPGTCGAFFFYRNDSSEIDMEFLSDDHQHRKDGNHGYVNLIVQSPESAEAGYVAPGSPDFDNHSLSLDPSRLYHEWRFDWLPDRVDFYVDSQWMRTITDNVPKSPGAIHVSHWSDGNPGWSGGPPPVDAQISISYIKAYFNSSDPETTQNSLRMCNAGDMPSANCRIPNQRFAPDPIGTPGNITGHTHFFSAGLKKSHPPDPTTTPRAPSAPSPPSTASRMSVESVVLTGVVALVVGGALVFAMREDHDRVLRALFGVLGGF